jgi:hypothetical protein
LLRWQLLDNFNLMMTSDDSWIKCQHKDPGLTYPASGCRYNNEHKNDQSNQDSMHKLCLMNVVFFDNKGRDTHNLHSFAGGHKFKKGNFEMNIANSNTPRAQTKYI